MFTYREKLKFSGLSLSLDNSDVVNGIIIVPQAPPSTPRMTLYKLLFSINIFSKANRALNDALSRKTIKERRNSITPWILNIMKVSQ